MLKNKTHEMGWQFNNTYARLPTHFYTRTNPVPVKNPKLVVMNETLASHIGLPLQTSYSSEEMAQLFSGNILPKGAESLAQAYAGHQFGQLNCLGDGRAHLMGEHITPTGTRLDIQLKGSGKTPYSRGGDGRAALGPMLREYIISEAMFALGIPTTRSLAVVTTGESIMRETSRPGAILTRVASSHIRVGTFEYAAHMGNQSDLQQLADYTIQRHFPTIIGSEQPYLDLLLGVMDRHIHLVTEWLRVGFIHGVMNTDNMTLSGETIDYGPCAFMDQYHPKTVFSSIDSMGRYAYANQPRMTLWNLARLAETLLPLIDKDQKKAITFAENTLNTFQEKLQKQWLNMMRHKLGLMTVNKGDEQLISALLHWMQHNRMDYTHTFRDLISSNIPQDERYCSQEFQNWWHVWQNRLQQNDQPLESALHLMRMSNPAIIPRNHQVDIALTAAEKSLDFTKLHTLLNALSKPYDHNCKHTPFCTPPTPEERIHQTFCGT